MTIKTYDQIIAEAATRIQSAIRAAAANPVYVFAVFTTPERDGEIVVLTGHDVYPDQPIGGYEVLRTQIGDRWDRLPVSPGASPRLVIYEQLHRAARNSRIMPLERAA